MGCPVCYSLRGFSANPILSGQGVPYLIHLLWPYGIHLPFIFVGLFTFKMHAPLPVVQLAPISTHYWPKAHEPLCLEECECAVVHPEIAYSKDQNRCFTELRIFVPK